MIYNGAHAYLYERSLDGWLARLDELEQFAAERGVHTIYPGHGQAGGLSLIAATREYLTAFAQAVKSGDAQTARDAMIARFPDYHALPFLTAFSLPAYFPATTT